MTVEMDQTTVNICIVTVWYWVIAGLMKHTNVFGGWTETPRLFWVLSPGIVPAILILHVLYYSMFPIGIALSLLSWGIIPMPWNWNWLVGSPSAKKEKVNLPIVLPKGYSSNFANYQDAVKSYQTQSLLEQFVVLLTTEENPDSQKVIDFVEEHRDNRDFYISAQRTRVAKRNVYPKSYWQNLATHRSPHQQPAVVSAVDGLKTLLNSYPVDSYIVKDFVSVYVTNSVIHDALIKVIQEKVESDKLSKEKSNTT